MHLFMHDNINVIYTMKIHEKAFLGPHIFFEKRKKSIQCRIQCPGPIHSKHRSFFTSIVQVCAIMILTAEAEKSFFSPTSRFAIDENKIFFPGICGWTRYVQNRLKKIDDNCVDPRNLPKVYRKNDLLRRNDEIKIRNDGSTRLRKSFLAIYFMSFENVRPPQNNSICECRNSGKIVLPGLHVALTAVCPIAAHWAATIDSSSSAILTAS